MGKEFIEKAYNAESIQKASTQEAQLSYILNSKLQDNTLNPEYINQWASRKFQTNDYFLNWVKMIFKTENFLSFFKYLRYPLPSTKIVHNRIEPQIRRVFMAEDADFKYNIQGKEPEDYIEDLHIKKFNKDIFERLLYKHNSLIVSDLDSQVANTPHRYFVDVKNVVSILEKDDKIWKIAFSGNIIDDNGDVKVGYIYIDDKEYSFYNDKHELVKTVSHDLGHTPVHFISPNKFDGDFVIRESIYTYIRGEIEEFNFLKTLQKMIDAGGTIPVVSKLEVEEEIVDQRGSQGEPSSDSIMGSQKPEIFSENESVGTGDLQPGTIHEIPVTAVRREDGSLDMAAVQNFLNFHYIPVEVLTFVNNRLKELEVSIVSTVVGDFLEGNEGAKNEDQIQKSISILENTLTSFAEGLNRIRTMSDYDMLALKYSPALVVEVFIHYGTDFFLDSQTKLFEDLEKAPNSLERKNIIIRISQNRYKNNLDQLSRQKLLYDLMPYVSDKDFEAAQAMQIVSAINKDYQTRFTYWISQFEAIYGDVTLFAIDEESYADRLRTINSLIQLLIKENQNEENHSSEDS